MIINSITIKNFQTYYKDIEFEFDTPDKNKNVILIGGLNGAGKTSFFSSLVLGLFGKNSEGIIYDRQVGENIEDSYQSYLRSAFSNEAKKNKEIEMEVSILLTHENNEIKIVRKWWIDESIDEILEVYYLVDGLVKPVELPDEEVDQNEYYESFIQSIIPSQVGRFFFFDGEEIKSIAKQDPEQAVVNGINALLGFNVLQQLIVDLETLKRNLRKELPGAAKSGLLNNYEELEKIEEAISKTNSEKTILEDDVENLNISLEELEHDISQAFKGRDVDSRNEVLDKIYNLDRELHQVENELQNLVGDVLTLALTPKLLDETQQLIAKEIKNLKQKDETIVVESLKEKFNKKLISNFSESDIGKKESLEKITKVINSTWNEIVPDSMNINAFLSNYFSTEEIQTALSHIDDIKATTNKDVTRLIGKQEALNMEKTELLSMQQLFDSGRYAQDILDKKSNALNSLSSKQHQLERLEAEMMVLNQEQTNIKNIIDRLESSLEISKEIQFELEEVEKYQEVIEEFMKESRSKRASKLSKKTSEVIKSLAHKEDLIHQVNIQKDSYAITLLDSSNTPVKKMSAGESEIFALSLLQALGEVSNRSLPVVIDTPLGRLDYEHRKSIVSNYFHNVSEQVFILSTDTEIDQSLYEELEPYIIQTFLIKSNKNKTSSVYQDQYFDFEKVKK